MSQLKTAKLFKNGASQAVRLPAEFRFDADQVYISRDPKTQDVILSTRPDGGFWEDFFKQARTIDIPEDWMKERPLNVISEDRESPLFREDD